LNIIHKITQIRFVNHDLGELEVT